MSDSQEPEKSTLELLRLVKLGDAKALDRILDIYIPQLKAFFRYIRVPEDCLEDLIQETFERVINKIESFDEKKKFSTWLMTVGKNIYVDHYRRNARGEEILAEKADSPNIADPERETLAKISVEEILKSLNHKERFIVEMRVFQKMPFSEIGELTGEEEATLRSRFFRAISKLRYIVKD